MDTLQLGLANPLRRTQRGKTCLQECPGPTDKPSGKEALYGLHPEGREITACAGAPLEALLEGN